MAIIFSASSDTRSFTHSSRIIAPLVRWFFPHISEHNLDAIVFGARKCAHATVYGILALLFWRALHKPAKTGQNWSWAQARLVLILSALYAATDELHQSFVPSRQASVWDVLLDTAGAGLALVLLWLTGLWRKGGE